MCIACRLPNYVTLLNGFDHLARWPSSPQSDVHEVDRPQDGPSNVKRERYSEPSGKSGGDHHIKRNQIVITQLSMVSHPHNNVAPKPRPAPLSGGSEFHEAESRLNHPAPHQARDLFLQEPPLGERRLSCRFN